MKTSHSGRPQWPGWVNIVRSIIGLIWLAGAAFNALVTIRMPRPYEWLEASPVQIYRWFFRDVAGKHPTAWTLLLAAGEVVLGALTLARGGWGRLGLAGGALFSLFLFSLGTVYTLVMAPYAVLLAWLARRDKARFPFGRLRAKAADGRRLDDRPPAR